MTSRSSLAFNVTNHLVFISWLQRWNRIPRPGAARLGLSLSKHEAHRPSHLDGGSFSYPPDRRRHAGRLRSPAVHFWSRERDTAGCHLERKQRSGAVPLDPAGCASRRISAGVAGSAHSIPQQAEPEDTCYLTRVGRWYGFLLQESSAPVAVLRYLRY